MYSIQVNAAERLILCRSKRGEWILCAILSDHYYKRLLQWQDCWFSQEELEEWSDDRAQTEEAPGAHCETKSDFTNWLKKTYGKNKEALVQNIVKNPERVYLECRIASGYDTVEDYVNVG